METDGHFSKEETYKEGFQFTVEELHFTEGKRGLKISSTFTPG